MRAVFYFLLVMFPALTWANYPTVEILPGVYGEVVKKHPPELYEVEEPSHRYLLEVRLGTLNQKKFNDLKALYNNSSNIIFNPTRNDYRLRDFLPPMAQALLDHLYRKQIVKPQEVDVIDSLYDLSRLAQNEIRHSSNCWSTSMEYMMSLHKKSSDVLLYIPDGGLFAEYINRVGITKSTAPEIGDMVIFQASREPGYWYPSHTAVIVAPGIVFEKISPDPLSPWRLAFLKDLRKWVASVGDPNDRISVEEVVIQLPEKKIERIDLDGIGLLGEMCFPVDRRKLEGESQKIFNLLFPSVPIEEMIVTCDPTFRLSFINRARLIDLDIRENDGFTMIPKTLINLFTDL